jgi:hypothetical protein
MEEYSMWIRGAVSNVFSLSIGSISEEGGGGFGRKSKVYRRKLIVIKVK